MIKKKSFTFGLLLAQAMVCLSVPALAQDAGDPANISNSIGDPLLFGYWKDPDFDAQQSAFYYVRVIEIPTPRWTTYDAKFFGVERPKDVPASIQDRAYTSPIWYTP
jgi:hypothetical protein